MIRTDMIHGFLTEIFITHTIPDILTIGDGEDKTAAKFTPTQYVDGVLQGEFKGVKYVKREGVDAVQARRDAKGDSRIKVTNIRTVGGKQVADMVEKIANGEKVSDIPYETISDYAKYVNMQAVKQFGGNFDKKAFEGFDVLVEEDGTSHFNK